MTHYENYNNLNHRPTDEQIIAGFREYEENFLTPKSLEEMTNECLAHSIKQLEIADRVLSCVSKMQSEYGNRLAQKLAQERDIYEEKIGTLFNLSEIPNNHPGEYPPELIKCEIKRALEELKEQDKVIKNLIRGRYNKHNARV